MLAELPNWGVERVKEMRVEGMDTMVVFPKLMLELLRYKGERIKMWSDSLLAGWESDAGRWKRGTYTPTFLLQSHLASQTLPTLRLSRFSFPGPPPSPPPFFFSVFLFIQSPRKWPRYFCLENNPYSIRLFRCKIILLWFTANKNTLFSAWCSHPNSFGLAI